MSHFQVRISFVSLDRSLSLYIGIRYNVNGAFVSELVDKECEIPHPSNGSPETRSMLYKTFLTTLLLNMSSREVQFRGHNGAAREDQQDIDHVLAAFTHSVLVDSNHTVIVTDIQGV